MVTFSSRWAFSAWHLVSWHFGISPLHKHVPSPSLPFSLPFSSVCWAREGAVLDVSQNSFFPLIQVLKGSVSSADSPSSERWKESTLLFVLWSHTTHHHHQTRPPTQHNTKTKTTQLAIFTNTTTKGVRDCWLCQALWRQNDTSTMRRDDFLDWRTDRYHNNTTRLDITTFVSQQKGKGDLLSSTQFDYVLHS